MTLAELLEQIDQTPDNVQFSDVMSVIEENYSYTPQAFSNGLGTEKVESAAGSNEGSCKIFAFAQLNHLSTDATLACFGDYYRQDVLQHPNNSDHSNIRQFMRSGWEGIDFQAPPLIAK